jgi:hypothetical protein
VGRRSGTSSLARSARSALFRCAAVPRTAGALRRVASLAAGVELPATRRSNAGCWMGSGPILRDTEPWWQCAEGGHRHARMGGLPAPGALHAGPAAPGPPAPGSAVAGSARRVRAASWCGQVPGCASASDSAGGAVERSGGCWWGGRFRRAVKRISNKGAQHEICGTRAALLAARAGGTGAGGAGSRLRSASRGCRSRRHPPSRARRISRKS